MTQLPAPFEDHAIRRVYDEKTQTWWFSVVDIVQVLTQQPNPTTARKYWNKLKQRLGQEGSQLVTDCHQLKLPAEDGKQRLTDAATAETLLRLVQSVPSPKAEPIKLWLFHQFGTDRFTIPIAAHCCSTDAKFKPIHGVSCIVKIDDSDCARDNQRSRLLR